MENKTALEEAIGVLMRLTTEDYSDEYKKGLNHAYYLLQMDFVEKDKQQRKELIIKAYKAGGENEYTQLPYKEA